MQSVPVPGTEGYVEDAEWLIPRYEDVGFVEKYKAVIQHLPTQPRAILDIGAGTGIDSAWLAARGHRVTAIEPVAPFREAGMKLHASQKIEWIDDSLPDLATLRCREDRFDVVLVAAVWFHLAPTDRGRSLANITTVLKPGGMLVISLRHGPAPANRRIFHVSAEEVSVLAKSHGLRVLCNVQAPSVQLNNRQAGVTWSWLVFQK